MRLRLQLAPPKRVASRCHAPLKRPRVARKPAAPAQKQALQSTGAAIGLARIRAQSRVGKSGLAAGQSVSLRLVRVISKKGERTPDSSTIVPVSRHTPSSMVMS